MKAVVEKEHGDAGVLEITEQQRPVLQAGQVLIKVMAAGLNRADVLQRQGHYPPPAGESSVYGLEVSGVVEEIGEGVHAISPGQEVMALLASGGYAEYVAVDARQTLPVPHGVSLVEAAGIPEVAATVYSNLCMVAGVGEDPADNQGKSILIHGGSGGIGAHAIELCVALGLRVFATASTAQKCDFIRSMGAHPINYRDEDFVEVIERETDGAGVNYILDVVGGSYLDANTRALAVEGAMVTIAVQGGAEGELNMARMMQKRLSLHGRTLRAQDADAKAAVMEGVQRVVVPLIASGVVSVHVDRVFDLDDVVAAHEYFDSGQHTGKVLLKMSEGISS